MLSTAPRVTALALAAVLLGSSSSAFAADRSAGALPQVDFTLTSLVPFVPGVPATIPPAMLVDITAAPLEPAVAADTPLAEAVQRPPIELARPRGDGPSGATTLRRGLILSFAALQVMDAMSTRKALDGGATEANPMMSGLAKNSAALYAVKAGSAAATAFFAERLARKHPRRATILMAVLNTAYVAVVAHNYRVARSQGR
jgi:hypothetical protein